MTNRLLLIVILLVLSVFGLIEGGAVNLCIRNNTQHESTCKLTSTILSAEEKSTFLKTMCVNQKDLKDDYRFIKILNDIAIADESYSRICDGTSSGVFAWIPYETFQLQVNRIALDATSDKRYLGRATDSKSKNQFCHMSDLSATEKSFFACVLVVFEDDFFSLESNLQVLVELLPIRYDIRNVHFEEWRNVTESYKTALGKTILKNQFNEKSEIFGSLEYTYKEKIKMNLRQIYSENKTVQLPVTFEYKENSIPLDDGGIGSVLTKSKTAFSWPLEPNTSIKVDIIGQWSEHHKQFAADVYQYYGIGLSLKKNSLKSTKISFIKIINVEHVFENLEILKHSKVTHSKQHPVAHPISELKDVQESESTGNGDVYPGFYPIFIIACAIVGTTFLTAMCGVIRASRRYSKQKQKHAQTI